MPAKRKPLEPKPTLAKEWAKADTLVPEELVQMAPATVSDGGGLSFTLEALSQPFDALDPREPPVRALLDQIDASSGKTVVNIPGRDNHADLAAAAEKLIGWRALASSEDEVLYARGAPPALITVAVLRQRKTRWSVRALNVARQLRATREGIRASSFRTDPDQPPQPGDSVLRLLVSEQTLAGGKLAYGRFMTPEVYLDDRRAVLRLYIRPQDGWQARTRRWETPVLVQLPVPLGEREVIDGAIYFDPPPRPQLKPKTEKK